jgi:hypothetical protein
MARVRSRISWLKDGDANTALFHSQARHRKRKNFISKLIQMTGCSPAMRKRPQKFSPSMKTSWVLENKEIPLSIWIIWGWFNTKF